MNVKIRDIFWSIFKCSGEAEVEATIENNEMLSNLGNWSPYGQSKNNFATFQNQQPHPVSALVEKITNSIDSMLLKECRLMDIDPKSQDAPKSINDAVEKFFKAEGGEIDNVPSDQRKKMSFNIQLIATGEKKEQSRPDLIIFDNAEGQHPDDFKETFLSLGKDNKNRIKFVQGKFNMGSTGAVIFCGEKHHYQLIASKLNEKLFQKTNHKRNLFGFTLIRKHPLTTEEEKTHKSSWYEYFSLDGKIPSFEIREEDFGLHKTMFKTGSIIKLFSYDLPRGYGGIIRGSLWQGLNQILYKPAHPFSVKDKRYTKKEGLDILPCYGNHVRLETHNKDMLEIPPIFKAIKGCSHIGHFSIKVFIFKRDKDRIKNYIGKFPVILISDGKVHGHLKKQFIKEELRLGFLSDTTLICIDCSKMRLTFTEGLFKADRWTMREDGSVVEHLKKQIIGVLKHDESLVHLNQKRKEYASRGGEDSTSNEIIKNVLSRSPMTDELKKLINKMGDLTIPRKVGIAKKKKKKKKKKPKPAPEALRGYKRFPSVFKINIKENNEGKKVKGIPLNGKGVISFETDVQEDYFYRPKDKGDLKIEILQHKRKGKLSPEKKGIPSYAEDVFEIDQEGPANQSIKIVLKPKKNVQINDEIELNAKLSSPDGTLEVIFFVKIEKNKNPNQEANQPPSDSEMSLPKIIEVYKKENIWVKKIKEGQDEEWDARPENWDEGSIIHIIEDTDKQGNNTIDSIHINMSSHSLKKYMANNKNEAMDEKKATAMSTDYKSRIYLHTLFLYFSLVSCKQGEDKHKNTEIGEEISNIFRTYGEALMYINSSEEIINKYT